MADQSGSNRITRALILVIALVQFVLGAIFVFAPHEFASWLGLPPAPTWTDWLFAMFGARAFGFAVGMAVAQRDIARHATWLLCMIGVQAIDWIATLIALASGNVTWAQASTAPFLPLVFIVVLGVALVHGRATDGQPA